MSICVCIWGAAFSLDWTINMPMSAAKPKEDAGGPYGPSFLHCCCAVILFPQSWEHEIVYRPWYAEAWRFPFNGTKGMRPTPEKQPHTIIQLKPNFTLKYGAPGNRQTHPRPVLPEREEWQHCSRVQWWWVLHFSLHEAVNAMLLWYFKCHIKFESLLFLTQQKMGNLCAPYASTSTDPVLGF